MSGHVSFQTSDDYFQPQRTDADVTISADQDISTREKQAQFMREASYLKSHGAQNNYNSATSDIDRLLYAIAETGGDLRLKEGDQAGHLAVTLDTITRWIGQAEERFKHLTETVANTQRILSNIVVLTKSQGKTTLSQIGETHHIACSTARNLTEVTQAVLQLNTSAHMRSTALRQKISSVQKAILLFEKKLENLETRLQQDGAKERTQHLTNLCHQLDAHSRLAAKNTASSIHFFELVTQKIERLGEELRAQKKAQAAELDTRQNLHHLIKQLENFIAAPVAKDNALTEQDNMAQNSCASPTQPQPFPHRSQPDILPSNPSQNTSKVNTGNSELRNRFIAAARHAARQDENAQRGGIQTSDVPSSEAGSRFFRRSS